MKIEIIGSFSGISNSQIEKTVQSLAPKLKISDKAILEIIAADNEEIAKLNKTYLGKDCATDVLSFPINQQGGDEFILGSIVISEEFAKSQNKDITELLKHGLLHLLGFDHEKDFDEWQRQAEFINHKM